MKERKHHHTIVHIHGRRSLRRVKNSRCACAYKGKKDNEPDPIIFFSFSAHAVSAQTRNFRIYDVNPRAAWNSTSAVNKKREKSERKFFKARKIQEEKTMVIGS